MQTLRPQCRCSNLPLRLSRQSKYRLDLRPARSFVTRSHSQSVSRSLRNHAPPHGRRKEACCNFSTGTKQYIQYQGRVLIYGAVVVSVVLTSGLIFVRLVQKDWLDKLYPTPREWWWLPRKYYRMLKYELDRHEGDSADWSMIARASLETINLLDNGWEESPYYESNPYLRVPQSWGPAPIEKQYKFKWRIPGMEDEGDMMKHPGGEQWASKIGPDISMQAEPWRRAYIELHMIAAKACEMRAGCYTLKGPRKIVFMPQYVLSEDNPNPVDIGGMRPPHVDDCKRSFPSPDQAYRRILTMKGTTRGQRIEAAIAYAKWMAATDRIDLAEQMHRYALDLACEGVEESRKIVAPKSGMIKPTAPFVTDNILKSTAALAEHCARNGKVSEALNIYLSNLYARRKQPEAPASQQYTPKGPDYSCTTTQSIITFIKHLPWEGQFPSPPPSGDQHFQRTRSNECERAALLAHVSEILFAKSDRKKQGVSYVRDAMNLSRAGFFDKKLTRKEWKVCRDCFETSLISWNDMLDVIVAEKIKRDGTAETRTAPRSTWDWLRSFVWSDALIDDKVLDDTDWATERVKVRQMLSKYMERKLLASDKGGLRPVGQN